MGRNGENTPIPPARAITDSMGDLEPFDGTPEPIAREDTGRMTGQMLAAGEELGLAPNGEGEGSSESELVTILRSLKGLAENGGGGGAGQAPPKGLKSARSLAILKYVITALLAVGGAYAGLKLAVEDNSEQIEAVKTTHDTHEAKPGHSGSASKEDLDGVKEEVRDVERKVDKLGVKIDEKAKAQTQQYSDIKDELKYLRRRRNRRDD